MIKSRFSFAEKSKKKKAFIFYKFTAAEKRRFLICFVGDTQKLKLDFIIFPFALVVLSDD